MIYKFEYAFFLRFTYYICRIIPKLQYGFRKNRSSTSAFDEFLRFVYKFTNEKIILKSQISKYWSKRNG